MEVIWLATAYGAGLGAKALRLPVLVEYCDRMMARVFPEYSKPGARPGAAAFNTP